MSVPIEQITHIGEVLAFCRAAGSAEMLDTPREAAASYRAAAEALDKVIAGIHVTEARSSLISHTRYLLGKAELLYPLSEHDDSLVSEQHDLHRNEYSNQVTSSPKKESRLTATIVATIRPRPDVKFKDIIGQEFTKNLLRTHVLQPHLHKSMYVNVRKRFTSFMLFGHPGTGKSMLAKAVAGESTVHTFFHVSSSVLISKWQGESAKLIARLFEVAIEKKPSIVFIDEVDSLALNRSSDSSDSTRRIKTELFMRLEDATSNVGDGVTLIVACNRPWELDSAFLERFECYCNITLPTINSISTIFGRELVNPLISDLTSEDCKKLGVMCQGLSARKILHICTQVLMEPISRIGNTTHFIKIRRSGETLFRAAHPSSPNVLKMNIMQIPADKIDFRHFVYREHVFAAVRRAGRVEDYTLQYRLEKFDNEMTGNSNIAYPPEPLNPVMWLYMCLCGTC